MSSMPRKLGIVLWVLCGALAALLLYRATHRPAGGNVAAGLLATPGEKSALAPSADSSASQTAAVPEAIPDIHMSDLQGQSVALRSYLGHPLIVNFWATWCPPCRREMPLLQQLWTSQRAGGLQIVGIAVDSPDAVKQFLRHTSVGYPLLVGEDAGTAAAARFGIEPVLPFSVFADAGGQIVAVKIGELHREEADAILGEVQAVSAGRTTLPQARQTIAADLRRLAIERSQHDSGDLSGQIGANR